MNQKFIHTYVSVDCVVFGFDNNQLYILLVQLNNDRIGDKDLKLPGSLIYDKEDVDTAAQRILHELTGIKYMSLKQFKCFSSPDRAEKQEDIKWMNHVYQPNIDRLITVAYLSLCKINRKMNYVSKYKAIKWCPCNQLPDMPFDHNLIASEALKEIRRWVERNPLMVFELLPQKFTISQYHNLYEAIYDKKIDLRNFYKKVKSMNFIVPLEKKQENVAHRAAQYFKLDKQAYNKHNNNYLKL